MASRSQGPCLWCGSTDVHKIKWGLPAGDVDEEWFVAASNPPPGPRPQIGCRNCGRMWSHVTLKIRRGEIVETALGAIKASRADVDWLRPIRAFLLEVFAEQRQIDAAGLKDHVGFPHHLPEVARLLALLDADCSRRGEPSLADLVAGVPEPPDQSGGESTEMISQDEINSMLDASQSEALDDTEPAPEPA